MSDLLVNCVGFINIVTIVKFVFFFEALINEQCPSCKNPIVGTNPIEDLDIKARALFNSWISFTICISYKTKLKLL